MLKHHLVYTDFNDNRREEDLYFNLTEAELVDIQANSNLGIQAELEAAIAENDVKKLLDFIKMLVHKSYGVKSEDGRHFRKSAEITEDFVNSAAYSDLLLSLFQDGGKRGVTFITGVMPADLVARATAQSQGQTPLLGQTDNQGTHNGVDRSPTAEEVAQATEDWKKTETIGEAIAERQQTHFRRAMTEEDKEHAEFLEWKRQQGLNN